MPKYLPFLAFMFLGGILPGSTVVSAQDTGRWTKGAPMLSERSEVAVAEVGGSIFAVGGFGGQRGIEIYDPAMDRWSRGAPVPRPLHHAVAVGLNGKLYVVAISVCEVLHRPVPSPITIDRDGDFVLDAEFSFGDVADVEHVAADGLRVLYLESAVAGRFASGIATAWSGAEIEYVRLDRPLIADLAAGFGVVIRASENDRDLRADVCDVIEVRAVPNGDHLAA